jgi:DNA-binding response OmpR family regulator
MSPSANSGARILVIDDDETIRDLLAHVLGGRDHRVVLAANGREGLQRLYAEHPDLIVLDVDMPEMDGWQTLERVRELGAMPVLMLTAKGAELEKVRALRGGADDYLTKPFGPQELAARVEALLRRASKGEGANGNDADRFYSDARLTIDHLQRLVAIGGNELRLTPLEYRLLSAFTRHPGQILSPDQLIELAWQDPLVQTGQVKLYVGRLRGKLAQAGAIETVRGFGYRYLPPSGAASQS